jgi:hypothetical protein
LRSTWRQFDRLKGIIDSSQRWFEYFSRTGFENGQDQEDLKSKEQRTPKRNSKN